MIGQGMEGIFEKLPMILFVTWMVITGCIHLAIFHEAIHLWRMLLFACILSFGKIFIQNNTSWVHFQIDPRQCHKALTGWKMCKYSAQKLDRRRINEKQQGRNSCVTSYIHLCMVSYILFFMTYPRLCSLQLQCGNL